MATLISHLKLRVPVIEEQPPELLDAFIKGMVCAIPKTYRHLKKALPDTQAVIDKLIKPSLKGKESFFNPDYVTRRGLEMRDILTVSEAEIESWARRYLKKTQYAFQDDKELIPKIKFGAVYYLKEMARLVLPFKGYKDKIRGVGPVGARWLTGDQAVLALIEPGELISRRIPMCIGTEAGKGSPPVDIVRHGQASRFRERFIIQVLKTGGQIVKTHYLPDQIEKGNVKINRLVNQYVSGRFAPFTPGGTSHVDFIWELAHLFLDIQVSVFE